MISARGSNLNKQYHVVKQLWTLFKIFVKLIVRTWEIQDIEFKFGMEYDLEYFLETFIKFYIQNNKNLKLCGTTGILKVREINYQVIYLTHWYISCKFFILTRAAIEYHKQNMVIVDLPGYNDI
ncbi:hypothetical protein KUTeg_004321 [Tegillarca granosa]|uniref:Uncharacterized protein n=1 Tax=Tegillarca granosa TaxID=220873 RepID=A0ABQ9FU52_TEGGR|nr:hypothetical protein KUTeg_004321 [Tegillarca granosa]